MSSDGDPHRESFSMEIEDEIKSKEYNLRSDSNSIYLDIHRHPKSRRTRPRAKVVDSISTPEPEPEPEREINRYITWEIEEVHDETDSTKSMFTDQRNSDSSSSLSSYESSNLSSYDGVLVHHSSNSTSINRTLMKKQDEEVHDYDSDASDASYMTAKEKFDDLSSLMRLYDHPLNDRPSSAPEDSVYIAIGKGRSSMGALFWTLTSDLINPSTTIFLVHILPVTRYVPSPLGMLPKHNVSADILLEHEAKAREKAKGLLKRLLDACCSDFQIENKVDAVLIENDSVGKTILNLIPFLKIKTLVLGTGKSKTLSRLGKLKKNGLAHQIYTNAPETCKVRLVCGGKELIDPEFATPMSSPASSRRCYDNGTPLSSSSSSLRSNSTSSSWLSRSISRSKSYSVFPREETRLDKSKSYSDFQIADNANKAGGCFQPAHMFTRSASTRSIVPQRS